MKVNNADISKEVVKSIQTITELAGCNLLIQSKSITIATVFIGTWERVFQSEMKIGTTCTCFGRTISSDPFEAIAIKIIVIIQWAGFTVVKNFNLTQLLISQLCCLIIQTMLYFKTI